MNLNQCSTANLRLMYKHGRISESEFLAEIEQREDEQSSIREQEASIWRKDRPHPQRLDAMFPADK